MEAPQQEPHDHEPGEPHDPTISSVGQESPVLQVESKARRSRLKPSSPLPSGRLNVDKELAMLKAYVSQSKAGEKAVHFNEIAGLVQTHETSVSASKEFWEEIGLLVRESRGIHKPSRDLVAWAQKVDFNPQAANERLHQTYDKAWFGETIRSAFQVHRALKKEALTNILANTAGGEQDETGPRTKLLLDLLVETGYLRTAENGDLVLTGGGAVAPSLPSTSDTSVSENPPRDRGQSATLVEQGIPSHVAIANSPGVAVSLELSISNWSVGDVIRLVKFLRTGEDEELREANLQAPKP